MDKKAESTEYRLQLAKRLNYILANPDAENVTSQEAENLIYKLRMSSRDDLAREIWLRYYDIIDDREKRVCEKLHLDPHDHIFTRKKPQIGTYAHVIFIDGYPEPLWWFVFGEFEPKTSSQITRYLSNLESLGLHEGVKIAEQRYADFLAKCSEVAHNNGQIPSSVPIERVSRNGKRTKKFDGLSAGMWRALNDPDYKPPLHSVSRWINTLNEKGETEKADFLFEKYSELFEQEFEPEVTLEDAEAYLKKLLSWPWMQ